MKRLLLALCFCLASAPASAQMMGGAYDSDAQAYFNALSANSCPAPSVSAKLAISTYIKAQRSAGNWNSQDFIYVPALGDSCSATINLAQSTLYKATVSGSCTFSVQNGLQGDASSCNMDSNVQQASLTRTSQNNAHICVFVGSGGTSNNLLGNPASGNNLKLNNITNKLTILNSAAAAGITDTGGAGAGFHCADRTSSSTITTLKDGVIQTNAGASTSSAQAASDVTVCKAGAGFCASTSNILLVEVGAPLNDEAANRTNARNLLLALGVTGI